MLIIFSYLEAHVIRELSVKSGPIEGGTRLLVYGDHFLNTGTIQVIFEVLSSFSSPPSSPVIIKLNKRLLFFDGLFHFFNLFFLSCLYSFSISIIIKDSENLC